MSDLTAIDVLVNPDPATIQHAREYNERMRASVPGGFTLDATHEPHVTTLQRYGRTAELDQVYADVAQTLARTTTSELFHRAVAVSSRRLGRPGPRARRAAVRARRCGI